MQKRLICNVCFIILVFMACTAWAEKAILTINPVPEVPKVKKIEPVPEVKKTEEIKKIEEVNFSDICTIDRIGKNDIVLDDDQYSLSPDVTFHSKTGEPVSKSKFRTGDKVGFVLKPGNNFEIISLWKIK